MDLGQEFASLSDCLRLQARHNPDEPAVAYGEKAWSFLELNQWVETVARNLWLRGLRPGTRVATLQHRRPDLVVAFLAVCRAGGLPVPVNVQLPEKKRAALLNMIGAEWVIAQAQYYPLLERSASTLPPRERWVFCDGVSSGGGISWRELERHAPTITFPGHGPDDDCYIHFTSGTSGQPKPVLCTHGNIWTNTVGADAALGLNPADRHLNLFAPFAHPHEILARPLQLGGLMVLTQVTRPEVVLDAVHRYNVTCIMGVPAVYSVLFRPLLKDPRLGSVRLFEAGGGVSSEELIDRFEEELGVPITPVWGSTETSGIAVAAVPGSDRPRGSCGVLCPGFEARILDEQGDARVDDQPGQLLLRGESVMKGYLDLPDETAQALRDGWYYTGDIFSRDREGCFYFKGRVDEMFKHRGFKIYPHEIEEILLRHPVVAQAAVVGCSSAEGGMEPVGFISCKPGQSTTSGELKSFCRDWLASYQLPRDIVILEVLPTTGSGKILKSKLLGKLGKK